ncbi:MAG: PmoA family protein [Planctomycetia bacterium]|nr:PmoA family protein [Planctomycetia bacterium]
MQRRDFLKKSALLTATTGLTVTLGKESFADSPKPAANFPGKEGKTYPGWGDAAVEHLTTYCPDFADNNLWIRKDNQIVTVYRTNPNQKYPYLYPLIGPVSRVSVTTESAQPWPHHRSVFMGVDKVNGGNYWQEGNDRGQILSQNVKVLDAQQNRVEFTDSCLWKKPAEDPIIADERRYVLDWRSDNYYVLDSYFSIKMLTDITIQKTNHGFFGVRVDQDLCPLGGGNLVSSEGTSGEKETFGKPAKWMAFYGKRRFNPQITEGVAVFSPPEKPFKDCPWFTRDYGNISPMPFLFIKDGETFEFKKDFVLEAVYRTVVFAGTPEDVDLDGLWNEIYG